MNLGLIKQSLYLYRNVENRSSKCIFGFMWTLSEQYLSQGSVKPACHTRWNSSSPSWTAGLWGPLSPDCPLFEQTEWLQRLGERYCCSLRVPFFCLKPQIFPRGRQTSFKLPLGCHLCTAGEQELLLISQSSPGNDPQPPPAYKIMKEDL